MCAKTLFDSRARPLVLAIGDAARKEFEPIARQLARETNALFAADTRAARMIAREFTSEPDVLIRFQSTPASEVDHRNLASLTQKLPLTPLVILLGPWCLGESRTSHPVPGAIRLPWYAWPSFWVQFREAFDSRSVGLWSLPRTTSAEEQIIFRTRLSTKYSKAVDPTADAADTGSNDHRQSVETREEVVVVAPFYENFRLIHDLLTIAGQGCRWLRYPAEIALLPRHLEGAKLVILDLWDDFEAMWRTFHKVREIRPRLPVLTLKVFPQPEEISRLTEYPPIRVISHPLDANDFLAAVFDVLPGHVAIGQDCSRA